MDQAPRRTAVVVAALALALLAAWAAWPAGEAEAADAGAALTGQDQVEEARRHLGTPYGEARCEAFRQEGQTCLNKLVYRKFGWDLPLNPTKQYRYGQDVERANLRKGDLVYFDTGGTRAPDFVGIYSGNGYAIFTGSYWGESVEQEMSTLTELFGKGSFRGGKRLAPR